MPRFSKWASAATGAAVLTVILAAGPVGAQEPPADPYTGGAACAEPYSDGTVCSDPYSGGAPNVEARTITAPSVMVADASLPRTITAPSVMVADASLPRTGSDPTPLVVLAAGLVAVGATAQVVSRRRRRSVER